MWQTLLENVLAPVARRVGSLAAGAVLTYGATADQAASVETLVSAMVLLLADLGQSFVQRKRDKRRVLRGDL